MRGRKSRCSCCSWPSRRPRWRSSSVRAAPPFVAERPAAEVRPEGPDLSRGLVVFDGCSLVDDVEIAREDGTPAQAMALLPAGLDMQNLGVGGRTTPMMASDAAAAVDPLYAAAISIVSAAHVGKNGGEERG